MAVLKTNTVVVPHKAGGKGEVVEAPDPAHAKGGGDKAFARRQARSAQRDPPADAAPTPQQRRRQGECEDAGPEHEISRRENGCDSLNDRRKA